MSLLVGTASCNREVSAALNCFFVVKTFFYDSSSLENLFCAAIQSEADEHWGSRFWGECRKGEAVLSISGERSFAWNPRAPNTTEGLREESVFGLKDSMARLTSCCVCFPNFLVCLLWNILPEACGSFSGSSALEITAAGISGIIPFLISAKRKQFCTRCCINATSWWLRLDGSSWNDCIIVELKAAPDYNHTLKPFRVDVTRGNAATSAK